MDTLQQKDSGYTTPKSQILARLPCFDTDCVEYPRLPRGLAVRISGFHPGGPGSIPGVGTKFFSFPLFISSIKQQMFASTRKIAKKYLQKLQHTYSGFSFITKYGIVIGPVANSAIYTVHDGN